MNDQLDLLDPDFKGTVVDYRQLVVELASRRTRYIETVMPVWDNTARRMHQALVFAHASPGSLRAVDAQSRSAGAAQAGGRAAGFCQCLERMAEGAHLEPDRRFGRQYLEATQRALAYGNARDVEVESELVAALRRD